MKVMAIGTLKPLSQEQRQKYLPKEVSATLQLYLDNKMEQFWMRDKEAGLIFLMNVDSVDEADRLLGIEIGDRRNVPQFPVTKNGKRPVCLQFPHRSPLLR